MLCLSTLVFQYVWICVTCLYENYWIISLSNLSRYYCMHRIYIFFIMKRMELDWCLSHNSGGKKWISFILILSFYIHYSKYTKTWMIYNCQWHDCHTFVCVVDLYTCCILVCTGMTVSKRWWCQEPVVY